jgi:hypothetical protein
VDPDFKIIYIFRTWEAGKEAKLCNHWRNDLLVARSQSGKTKRPATHVAGLLGDVRLFHFFPAP